jgi:hypothetical protein
MVPKSPGAWSERCSLIAKSLIAKSLMAKSLMAKNSIAMNVDAMGAARVRLGTIASARG